MELKYDHLTGIPFTGIGRDDCFSLVIKFFADNFEITITDYARPHDWESDKVDLIRLFYEREGFEMITNWKVRDLRPGDVLAMSYGESNANHLAVFLGDDKIVHHLYGRMSREEPFHGFWRDKVGYVLRHKDVPDLSPVNPSVDIMEIIRARNTTPAE